MKFRTLTKKLIELAKWSKSKGHIDDEADFLFKAQMLILVEDLLDKFKGIEKQMKYLWQTLEELKAESKEDD